MAFFYYGLAMYFFGYFVCLTPKSEPGEHWIVSYLLSLLCFFAALIFPITLTAVFVVRRYELKKRQQQGDPHGNT